MSMSLRGKSDRQPEWDESWEYDPDDLECTRCGGDGFCWDGADPLGNCPDEIHKCHACNGSGARSDQVVF